MKKVEQHVSMGGVVCRRSRHAIEIALCHSKAPVLWALPKGTPEIGESMEQTALREVREETGLEVRILDSLGYIEYSFMRKQDNVKCEKRVHFYLMEPIGGDFSLHDPEFDEVDWHSENDVLKIMTYSDEVRIVEKALKIAPNLM
tara:strand:- start:430 stop:864 length:435 start_codon:yes stop_codon:yes gene_type:complete